MPKLAERMIGIGTETAFEAAARGRALEAQGKHIVHLEIGEPDFDTPENIRDAAKRALDEGWTHYGPPLGQPKLRQAIADESKRFRGIDVDPANVVVTPGAKPIMYYAILALIEDGDEVMYPDPGFPIYESMTRFTGGTPVPYALREENDFRLDPDELRSLVTPRTKMIIFNSPHNPTGGVLAREDIEAIADIARNNDNITVLADEIYGRGVFEGEHVSIASMPNMMERTIILDGFSKAWAMTGWRLGFAVLPPALVDPFSKLIINSVSCTSSFEQMAAVEALNGPQDEVARFLEEFRARRQIIVDGLNAIPGIRCRMPHGAFYVFPNVAGTGMNGTEMADRLLYEGGVCTLSGTAFGQVGKDHIRISYANSRENLKLALERIHDVVSKVPAGSTA
ncbi:MAG: pyridoxal phosphate-dependent aminotransferase [Candidatus Limnocylindrales bacterium]